MNTTMAEGAAQRLVAQISEHLLGKPGLNLMELETSLRELRGAGGPLLAETVIPVSGDARALSSIYELLGVRNESDAGAEIARLHIAARQPVGQIIAWHWPSTGVVCSAEAVTRDRARTDNAVPLYAAPQPPAQWVEHQRLHALVAEIDDECGNGKPNFGRVVKLAADAAELSRRLIDSQEAK